MILEMVLGLLLTVSGGGKAEVDPTTTILKMLVKGNEIQKRIPIGRIISGLSFQNNRIVFMEEVDDKILIHKYLIK